MLLYLKGDLSFSDTTCGIILLSYFLSQYEVHSLQWIVKYNSDSSDNVNILTAIIRDQTHLYAQWPYLFTSTHTAVEKFCKTFSREKFVQCGYTSKYFKDHYCVLFYFWTYVAQALIKDKFLYSLELLEHDKILITLWYTSWAKE